MHHRDGRWAHHDARAQRDCAPSMGPRFCKRGNASLLWGEWRRGSASMGPRFCKRGNITIPAASALDAALQWGHAFVSVETALRMGDVDLQSGASMGPRFCKRGNRRTQCSNYGFKVLQWGHAFVSVETKTRSRADVAAAMLQWGHAFVSVETRQAGCASSARASFNGATLL